MKKKIYNRLTIIILALFVLSACEKYTDITPKGKNVLSRVSDLDLLMNYDYELNAFNFLNHSVLINDMYPRLTNIPNIINGTIKDLNYALVTYDETIDRASLTLTDGPYEGLYGIVVNVANIVLNNADGAVREKESDEALAQQLKAEAYILRAYCHYLLVNAYAKAYDPATAETDGGVPYVSDFNLEEVNVKRTVKEVYENMLADLNAAFTLDALPDSPKNNMRIGKSFAYAVKARILLSMHNYEEALAAADSGLVYNNVLEDHRPFLPVGVGEGQGLPLSSRDGVSAPDNLFVAFYIKNYPFLFAPSLEIMNNYYEEGNIIKDHTSTYNTLYGPMLSGISGTSVWFQVYQQNTAGMTSSDLYGIKAECLARTGDYGGATNIINYIRERRVYPYEPLENPGTEAGVMEIFKQTARIEYLFTWKNFVNIKRWNAEETYAETITRTVNGRTYTLTPDSPLWIFPFPKNATDYNSTLTQNY